MNKILEVHDFEKGKEVEIQGQVTYSMEPRQYGKNISQFIVVEDETGKQGCNITLGSMEDKFVNGNNVHVEGVVDKYLNKKNPNPDGSFPIATSIKGYVVEETISNEDFPYGANVGESYKDDPLPVDGEEGFARIADNSTKKPLPAKSERKPIELKNPQPKQTYMTQQDYWREKSFRDIENNKCIVRECAIKAVTELAVAKIANGLKSDDVAYFKFAEEIVDWIYKNPQAEEQIIEEDLILSGAKTKAEIIDYITEIRAGTPYEQDAEFYVALGCQLLKAQTKAELIETVEKFRELLGGK